MTPLDCARTVELLPWYLGGSLDEGEREGVERHLHACASCREQLEETRHMMRIASQHVPAELLADYACGIAIAAADRRALEEHLAVCETCAEEVAPALGERSAAPAPHDPHRDRQRVRRPLALAASILAAVAVGALLSPGAGWRPRAAANVAFVELLPAGERSRGDGGPSTAVDPAAATTVVLITDRQLADGDHRLRVARPEGDEVQVLSGLVPDRSGVFVLHVPAGAWPSGTLSLVLETADGETWQPIETYSVRVVAAGGP